MNSSVSIRPYVGWLTTAMVLCLPLLTGCSNRMEAHPVNSDEARHTLEAVLESWQEGATPESWQQKSPAVTVQDMDWKTGKKLKSYEIVEPCEAVDSNLHCQVKLTLEDPEKGEMERTVTYLVGTSPVLTVFREVAM